MAGILVSPVWGSGPSMAAEDGRGQGVPLSSRGTIGLYLWSIMARILLSPVWGSVPQWPPVVEPGDNKPLSVVNDGQDSLVPCMGFGLRAAQISRLHTASARFATKKRAPPSRLPSVP
jgi:hypothetical protein